MGNNFRPGRKGYKVIYSLYRIGKIHFYKSNDFSLEGLLEVETVKKPSKRFILKTKNAFYIILRAHSALKIFNFCLEFFEIKNKWLDVGTKASFKIYGVTIWFKNSCYTHIGQYLTK